MAGCCCRLCVLADPVFLAATDAVCHLDPFNRKGSQLVVRVSAWRARTLGRRFKMILLLFGERGRHIKRDCRHIYQDVFIGIRYLGKYFEPLWVRHQISG